MRTFALALLLTVGLAACGIEPAAVVRAYEQVQWHELGIEDYRIVFVVQNLNGMGGSPGDGVFDVTVEGGEVARCRVEPVSGGSEDDCAPTMRDPVDKLFGFLDRHEPEYTTVSYSSELHIPEQIEYDVPNIADEEYRLSVSEFERLD